MKPLAAPANIQQRAAKLRDQINELRYRYHVLDDPEVSDEIYDSLTQELKKLEAKYPVLITPESPTQRIGGQPLAKFESAAHEVPMLSLNDVFSRADLEAWIKRITKLLPEGYQPEYFVDLKMDGLAAAVVYEDGLLKMGLTRGNGYRGENVTQNLRTIHNIPLKLRLGTTATKALAKGRVEVRGEVVIYKEGFAQVNAGREAAGLALYANPRNLAAGSVRQLDPKLTAQRPLKFHAYSVITEPAQPTVADEYRLARQLGFIVNSQARAFKKVADVIKFAENWESKRHDLPFQTDGLVVSINNRQQFRRLGVVGKAPRGAVAYKYPPERATTKIKDIIVSIGRTGAATPVAVMEPVTVAGSTVRLATLHNEDEVARKDVRIGDTVIIHKAGDVIPEVVAPLPKMRTGKERKFKMPTHCPVCGTKLQKLKADEAVWRCPNSTCPAKLRGQIFHFASKDAFDIEGLGEKNVKLLLQTKLIGDAADLYKLQPGDLTKLERFAEKSAAKLTASIQSKKRAPLDRFLYGLGIRHVGRQTAIDLAHHFGSLANIRRAKIEDFEAVEGIGQVVAHSIYAWFIEEQNQQLLNKLAQVGVKPLPLKTGTKLAGQSFVITGTLEAMSRDEAAERIRALGGKFQSSVSKETTYVVVGDNPGQNKIDSARKYQIKPITETELLKIIKD